MTERWQREVRKLGSRRARTRRLEGPGATRPGGPGTSVSASSARGSRRGLRYVRCGFDPAAGQAVDPVGGPAAGGDDAPGHLPDAVRITCGTRRDEVATLAVRWQRQPDGVHFLVENEVDARGILGTMPGHDRRTNVVCPRSPTGTPSAVRSSCRSSRPGSSTSRARGPVTLRLLRDSARVNRCPSRSSTSMVSGLQAT